MIRFLGEFGWSVLHNYAVYVTAQELTRAVYRWREEKRERTPVVQA